MVPIDRRLMFGGLASGLAGLAVSRGNAQTIGQAAPSTADGHAAGLEVAPSASFNLLVPRRPGEAAAFTASLDGAAIKATPGGWAREVTTRQLPLATRTALASMPLGDTYIAQGTRLAEDGTEARGARPLDPGRTHRYRDLRRTKRHV